MTAAKVRPDPPAYWLSSLAEECLELLEVRKDWVRMQERIRAAAAEHRLTPNALAAAIAREWDRIGFVTGDRRALVR
jgi:hypothetical protein